MFTDCNKPDMFAIVSPHISGMHLGEINRLIDHMNNDTFDEFTEYIAETHNNKFKTFYEINRTTLEQYMQRRDSNV